ncbi:PREDICTED: cytochrome c oxidase assembly protein COX11, mitochondrial isoform X1 [Nelumbo nucifera]|uniref:Cytochrome c oxidase assembly protein COX11, mitochondrial isoform X1 n=1 Tax=Nelumbo nucifera TaxID=4432 RepID=A0A1U8B1C1_NELNU|nr:PREDICTED: cytochrome c oxidase assembly protein COX11, mitochondrial isoform X1 [Nelumbo nucifera]
MFCSRLLSKKIPPLPCLKNSRSFLFETKQVKEALGLDFNGGSILGGSQFWGFTSRREFTYMRPFGVNCNCVSTTFASRNLPRCSSSTVGPWVRRGYTTQTAQAARERKSKKTLVYLTAVACVMVGCTYAAVPLYRRFCQATGYGGTVQRRETVEEKIARHAQDGSAPTREVVVQFNADVADGMPWKFVPTQREVRVKPGESALAFYTAENRSSTPITGVSTYNVTPMKAAVYFNKIQCFCFEEQRLLPGEQIDMPVFFYIDPEFETDPRMDGVNNLILSYTFFKVGEE